MALPFRLEHDKRGQAHHLKILHDSGALASEKIGKEVWFWIDRPVLETTFTNVLDYLKENC